MGKTHGFTVIELVLVLLLIGILAVLPFFNWPGNVINLDAQAKQFADDIRFTQSLSMSKNDDFRIVRTSSTSYQIVNKSGTAITLANGSSTINLNSGLAFGTWSNLPSNLIAFDSRGIPYLDAAITSPLVAGTNYSITISGGGNTKTVTITPITGMVLIQ